MVVPLKSRSQLVGDANVVSRGIDVAAEDVHDALLDAMHVDG
jgi:hypothetical protein